MPVNTAKIRSRRQLEFTSLRDVLADADRLSSGNAKTLGNWSAGQIFRHLAKAFNGSIDGYAAPFPWYIRLAARPFKKRLIHGAMPPGLKLPAGLAKVVIPEPTATEDGLAELHAAVARLEREPKRAKHPVFGDLSKGRVEPGPSEPCQAPHELSRSGMRMESARLATPAIMPSLPRVSIRCRTARTE